MKYYKVTAKYGHVGKGFYYLVDLFIKAENGRDAAKVARKMPRVKHEHKDAALNVREIDLDTYLMRKEAARKKSIFSVKALRNNLSIGMK